MSRHAPHVTVAMPLYNGASTIARAIDSILQQTFTDFELVLIDDGCSDNTVDIVRSYNDPRIRLIVHETNQGLAATRNHLVEQARGEFIAWLDQDDWSHPERLARQVALFTEDSELAICGTWSRIESDGRAPTVRDRIVGILGTRSPSDDATIRATQPFGNLIATSSVTMSVSKTRDKGLQFDERLVPAEDFSMWIQAGEFGRYRIIPEFLTGRMETTAGAATVFSDRQRDAVRYLRHEMLRRVDPYVTKEQEQIHERVCEYLSQPLTGEEIASSEQWLSHLVNANQVASVYDHRVFRRVCAGALARAIATHHPRNHRTVVAVMRRSQFAPIIPYWALHTALRTGSNSVRPPISALTTRIKQR